MRQLKAKMRLEGRMGLTVEEFHLLREARNIKSKKAVKHG